MKRNRRKVAAGLATTTIAEPLLLLSHQGGPGVIVGLALGLAAYLGADEVADWRECHGFRSGSEEQSEAAPVLRVVAQGKSKGAGFGKRLLVGRSVREAEAAGVPADEEPETVFVDEEDEDLAVQDLLELGRDLHPHVNWFFSKRVSILGMSGSGKSNLLARLVECLGKYDAPLILFDSKPEYRKLCRRQYLVNAFHASRQNLTPQNARAAAYDIMNRRLQVVVDLTSYEPEEAAQVMIELALGVASYQQVCQRKGEAFVIGPDGSRGVYRIYRRESPDEARSPGVESLARAVAPASMHVNATLSPGANVKPSLTLLTRPQEGSQATFDAGVGVDAGADSEREEGETGGSDANATALTPGQAPGEKYTLTHQEITRFLAEYRHCRNRDEALRRIGRGSSNYRECANRILEAYGLRTRQEA